MNSVPLKIQVASTVVLAALVLPLLTGSARVNAAELVHAKDGSGVYGYSDTPRLPWCGYRVHDPDRPAPRRVDAGPASAPASPPSDAIVLFDGTGVSKWEAGDWKLVEGTLESVGGSNFKTKENFGSCQIHVEWMPPAGFQGTWDCQGNNGVLIMGLFEIQIFDSWNEKIYPDGQAGAVYGQTPPLVNVCRKPGEWQTYDIAFSAPVFEGDKLQQPARVTIFHNGVLIHLNQEIYGETGHRILPEYKHKISEGPLTLAGHHCPVRFRNIWVRPLK